MDLSDKVVLRIIWVITCLLLGAEIGKCTQAKADQKTGAAKPQATKVGREAGSYTLPFIPTGIAKDVHVPYDTEGEELVEKAKYRIGVIDTGYLTGNARLCKDGHYNFYTDKSEIAGTHPHGTIVSNIIATELDGVDYCIVVFQVVNAEGEITADTIQKAVMKASKQKLTAVNISLAGAQSNLIEQRALNELTKSGAKIFTASGNDSKDLDKACQIFPACYDVQGMSVVGAMTGDLSQPAAYSNYGTKVKLWYSGDVGTGRGTSFATPRALSDYILSISRPLPQ